MENKKNILDNHDTINFGFWIWHSLENRLYFSDGFAKILGITSNTTLETGLLATHIHADDIEEFSKVLKLVFDSRQPKVWTFRVCLNDGSIRNIQCAIMVMGAEWMDIQDVIGLCHDMDA